MLVSALDGESSSPAPSQNRGGIPLIKGLPLPSTTAKGKDSMLGPSPKPPPASTGQGQQQQQQQQQHVEQPQEQQQQQRQQQIASVALGAISNLLMLMPTGGGLQLSPPPPRPHPARPTSSQSWQAEANIPHYIPEDQQADEGIEGRLKPGAGTGGPAGSALSTPAMLAGQSEAQGRPVSPSLLSVSGDRGGMALTSSGPPHAPSLTSMVDNMPGSQGDSLPVAAVTAKVVSRGL